MYVCGSLDHYAMYTVIVNLVYDLIYIIGIPFLSS